MQIYIIVSLGSVFTLPCERRKTKMKYNYIVIEREFGSGGAVSNTKARTKWSGSIYG